MKKILLFSMIILFAACQKNYELNTPVNESMPEESIDMIQILSQKAVIGEQLPNPYSLENMKAAYAALDSETKSSINESDLTATHHYVMFKPSCHEEYRSLIMTSGLDLNSFPLDHEISDGWVVVNPDPAYSTNGYSHKWAYVPVSFDLSVINCPYEILYDIISVDEEELTKSSGLSAEIFMVLERKSYEMCNLEYDELIATKSTEVVPCGRIIYSDSSAGASIGCYGMSVKASRLAKSSYGHCDDDGYFVCDKSFKHDWKYTVFFSRTDFEMRRDTSTEEVMLVFTDRHGPLNLEFTSTSSYNDNIYYCEILRAACKYYYDNIDGLHRPPLASELNDRLYIRAIRGESNDNSLGSYGLDSHSIPAISVYRDDSGSNRLSASIYCTTIHELAHASHWNQNRSIYSSCASKVKETFATGVGVYLTRKVHPSFTYSYGGNYSGLVEDMIDDDGYVAGSLEYHENIRGFTIQQVENSVLGVTTWQGWQDRIEQLYPNNINAMNICTLFAIWN